MGGKEKKEKELSMGLAASQAQLLSITSRMSDNELRAQLITNDKQRLAGDSAKVSERYLQALNDAQLTFTGYDAFGTQVPQQLTFNNLTRFNKNNQQYGLSNIAGQLYVTEADADKFQKAIVAEDSLNAFLEAHGLKYETTYFDNLSQYLVGDGQPGNVSYRAQNDEGKFTTMDTGYTVDQIKAIYYGESALNAVNGIYHRGMEALTPDMVHYNDLIVPVLENYAAYKRIMAEEMQKFSVSNLGPTGIAPSNTTTSPNITTIISSLGGTLAKDPATGMLQVQWITDPDTGGHNYDVELAQLANILELTMKQGILERGVGYQPEYDKSGKLIPDHFVDKFEQIFGSGASSLNDLYTGYYQKVLDLQEDPKPQALGKGSEVLSNPTLAAEFANHQLFGFNPFQNPSGTLESNGLATEYPFSFAVNPQTGEIDAFINHYIDDNGEPAEQKIVKGSDTKFHVSFALSDPAVAEAIAKNSNSVLDESSAVAKSKTALSNAKENLKMLTSGSLDENGNSKPSIRSQMTSAYNGANSSAISSANAERTRRQAEGQTFSDTEYNNWVTTERNKYFFSSFQSIVQTDGASGDRLKIYNEAFAILNSGGGSLDWLEGYYEAIIGTEPASADQRSTVPPLKISNFYDPATSGGPYAVAPSPNGYGSVELTAAAKVAQAKAAYDSAVSAEATSLMAQGFVTKHFDITDAGFTVDPDNGTLIFNTQGDPQDADNAFRGCNGDLFGWEYGIFDMGTKYNNYQRVEGYDDGGEFMGAYRSVGYKVYEIINGVKTEQTALSDNEEIGPKHAINVDTNNFEGSLYNFSNVIPNRTYELKLTKGPDGDWQMDEGNDPDDIPAKNTERAFGMRELLEDFVKYAYGQFNLSAMEDQGLLVVEPGHPAYDYYKKYQDAGKELAMFLYGSDYCDTKIENGKEVSVHTPPASKEYYSMTDPLYVQDMFEGNHATMSRYFPPTQTSRNVIDGTVLENIFNTYGEPKMGWVDSKGVDAEKEAAWYTNLFNRMMNGYKALEDGLANSPQWIEYALTSGFAVMEQVDSTNAWSTFTYTNCADIQEKTDTTAVAIAEAEYNRDMNKIQTKDKRFDMELKRIDTEHSALQVEYDSVKSAMNKNIERTMKIFSA